MAYYVMSEGEGVVVGEGVVGGGSGGEGVVGRE